MNKFAALALLLGLFAVVGCEAKKTEPAATPAADAPATEAPATEAPAEPAAQ